MGKNAGDDLAEGKPTLPLIFARQRCNETERELLDTAIRNGGGNDLGAILSIIKKTDSLNASMAVARTQADKARKAISVLAESPWRTALEQLAVYSVNRDR